MAKDSVCVFCGEKPGAFRSTTVQCGNTWQVACKSCEKELKELDEVEICRRALVRGLAEDTDRVQARIALITEAEEHRPKCLSCGGRLTFMEVQQLDNSPLRDTGLKEPFEVLPACCEACGQYAFYDPTIARSNQYLAYLIQKDTQKC